MLEISLAQSHKLENCALNLFHIHVTYLKNSYGCWLKSIVDFFSFFFFFIFWIGKYFFLIFIPHWNLNLEPHPS